jgi:5'-phosphate synthase pdxT subunit
MEIGVLAFQGSVIEHARASQEAAGLLGIRCRIREVRTAPELEGLDGLIIPGGESTTMYKLCLRGGMLEGIRGIPGVFGTCAGAIMLAKKVRGAEEGQGTLGLMDIEVGRNAYGTQAESFEEELETEPGPINAIFIRAPRIISSGSGVKALARRGGETVACEQRAGGRYYLAACFHPELSSPVFHSHFLRSLRKSALKT